MTPSEQLISLLEAVQRGDIPARQAAGKIARAMVVMSTSQPELVPVLDETKADRDRLAAEVARLTAERDALRVRVVPALLRRCEESGVR